MSTHARTLLDSPPTFADTNKTLSLKLCFLFCVLRSGWGGGGEGGEGEDQRGGRETGARRGRGSSTGWSPRRGRAKTNPIVHDPSIFRAKEPEPQPPPLLEEQDEQEEEEEVVPTVTEVVEEEEAEEKEDEEEGLDVRSGRREPPHRVLVLTLPVTRRRRLRTRPTTWEPQGGAHLPRSPRWTGTSFGSGSGSTASGYSGGELSRALRPSRRRTQQQQQQPQRPVIWGTDRYKQLFAMAASMPDPEEVEEAEDVAAVVDDEEEEEREEEDPKSIGAQYRDLLERTAGLGRASRTPPTAASTRWTSSRSPTTVRTTRTTTRRRMGAGPLGRKTAATMGLKSSRGRPWTLRPWTEMRRRICL